MPVGMTLTRSESMRARHAAARIDGWLSVATAVDLAGGLAWYETAHHEAELMAQATGLSVRSCAGVIAALSPRCQWGSNLAAARHLTIAAAAGASCPAVSTTANRSKAWRIARGADPELVLAGPKVRAFFQNIMGDTEAVTVDVWAARAAEGCSTPGAPTGRRYELLAEAFRRVAEDRGMHPRDVQAAVWTVYRRLHREATS